MAVAVAEQYQYGGVYREIMMGGISSATVLVAILSVHDTDVYKRRTIYDGSSNDTDN